MSVKREISRKEEKYQENLIGKKTPKGWRIIWWWYTITAILLKVKLRRQFFYDFFDVCDHSENLQKLLFYKTELSQNRSVFVLVFREGYIYIQAGVQRKDQPKVM